MSLTSEVRSILEAARGKALSSTEVDTLIIAYERLQMTIEELNERTRFLRDAAELFRLKAAHLESRLQSVNNGPAQPASGEAPGTSPDAHGLSPDARRILAGLAEQDRTDFWSKEISPLSRGLNLSDIAAAVEELLDHEVIEELSYMMLEGTHYGCTARGRQLIRAMFPPGR